MPWENNGGGGGRNNGGPWGQAPGGGGGSGGGNGGGGPRRPGGGNTPNLEDIFNRGRDQFRGGVPGGRWAIVGGVLVLLAFWGVNSVYTINPQEVGVELRFGQPKPELSGPGLHFMLWPVESVERATTTVNQTQIGAAAANATSSRNTGSSDGLMLSGDQNIVSVQFSVFWAISSPVDYLFNVRDQESMVRYAAESAMREVVGRRPAQDIYSDDRAGIQNEVLAITQGTLESYGLGVTISQILIENAGPPAEVVDAFNEVQRARQDETRLQEEARSYANTLLGDARGRAAAVREEAAAYSNRVVQEATGEAERFNSIYAEYVNAPEVTRQRLFLETMEQVLGNSEKVLVEGGAGGSGIVPYLPLPELRSRTTAPNASTGTGE